MKSKTAWPRLQNYQTDDGSCRDFTPPVLIRFRSLRAVGVPKIASPVAAILFLMTTLIFTAASCNRQMTVELAGKKLNVEIADDVSGQTRGLGGRPAITDWEGMLFLFDQKATRSFWMKDMKFALDIIWIDGDEVVDISRNVKPQPGAADSELIRYLPEQAIDKVLELNAGWSQRNGLKIGDKIEVK